MNEMTEKQYTDLETYCTNIYIKNLNAPTGKHTIIEERFVEDRINSPEKQKQFKILKQKIDIDREDELRGFSLFLKEHYPEEVRLKKALREYRKKRSNICSRLNNLHKVIK